MRTQAILGVVVLSLFTATATADEVRLKDGRVLVGDVEKRGKIWEIATRDGTVRVAAAEVLGHRTDEDLREELGKLQAGTPNAPFGILELARQAHAWGLDEEMWGFLDDVVHVRRKQQDSGLVNRMNDFLAQLEPELLPRRLRKAKTQKRVKELLYRVRKGNGPGKFAAVEELLVREPNADRDLRIEARHGSQAPRKLVALEALVRRGTGGNDRFLYRTAILDRSAQVRAEAMGLAASYRDTAAVVDYLAPGLMHPNHIVRMRTADAYANLQDSQAVKLLVAAGPSAGASLQDAGSSVRGHIAIINQTAYLRDFDVEVAQASFIADPKVDVLQSGSVMDVTVHAVVTHRTQIVGAYRNALKRLVGSDPGPKASTWAAWLASVDTNRSPAPSTAGRASTRKRG